MHTQIDLRGPIPTCIFISPAKQHDVRWLDQLAFEPGAFYVMDRGYMDFARPHRIASSGAFFVTRAKDILQFARHGCAQRSDRANQTCQGAQGLPLAVEQNPVHPEVHV